MVIYVKHITLILKLNLKLQRLSQVYMIIVNHIYFLKKLYNWQTRHLQVIAIKKLYFEIVFRLITP